MHMEYLKYIKEVAYLLDKVLIDSTIMIISSVSHAIFIA